MRTAVSRVRHETEHAGMGIIKECLRLGVPMIAVPLERDQFANARLIADHGVAFVGNIDSITVSELVALIDRGLEDRELRACTARMREAVLREDAAVPPVDYVVEVLRPPRPTVDPVRL